MKNIKYLLVLLVLGFLFVSCEKQQEIEWKKLYGYTSEDVAGTYSFSKVEDAFEGLTESAYCHICEDAIITVMAKSGKIIDFRVNCPNDSFIRRFEGRPCLTDDSFLINMTAPSGSSHPDNVLEVYVYKNDQGDIRLHGYARRVIYDIVYNPATQENDYVPKSNINYWFDVIKN